MLPYPTDRRRLLMMVRSFLHGFSEFVGSHHDGWTYPSEPDDPCADHELERFLERLAIDAGEVDESFLALGTHVESEEELRESVERCVRSLLRHGTWNGNRLSAN